MADFQAMETNRSLQFEFKLLTKNFYFAFNQIVKHLRIQPTILQKRITCRPRKPFGRSRNTQAKFRLFAGRDDYNQKFSITAAIIQLRVTGGNLKELLQKRGLSGLQSEEAPYYKAPLPCLAANPTQTAQSTSAINYSSRLMFTTQGAFQPFLRLGENPAARRPSRTLLRSTAKPE